MAEEAHASCASPAPVAPVHAGEAVTLALEGQGPSCRCQMTVPGPRGCRRTGRDGRTLPNRCRPWNRGERQHGTRRRSCAAAAFRSRWARRWPWAEADACLRHCSCWTMSWVVAGEAACRCRWASWVGSRPGMALGEEAVMRCSVSWGIRCRAVRRRPWVGCD